MLSIIIQILEEKETQLSMLMTVIQMDYTGSVKMLSKNI